MDNELLHYGVKGMRWGRRKSNRPSVQESAGERDARINTARANVNNARATHRRAVRKSLTSTSAKKREYYKKDAAVRKAKLKDIKAANKDRFKFTSQDVAFASTAAGVVVTASPAIAKMTMTKLRQAQNRNLSALEAPRRDFDINNIKLK